MSQPILLLVSAARRGKAQNKKHNVILGSQTPPPHHPLILVVFYSFIQSYIGKANLAKVQGKVNAKNDPAETCLETLESQVMNMGAVLNPYLNFSVA